MKRRTRKIWAKTVPCATVLYREEFSKCNNSIYSVRPPLNCIIKSNFHSTCFSGQCSRKLNPFSRNCVVMQSLTSGYDNTMAASSFPRSFLLLKRGTWEPGCYGSYSFSSSLTSAINGYLPKRPLIIYCPGGGV